MMKIRSNGLLLAVFLVSLLSTVTTWARPASAAPEIDLDSIAERIEYILGATGRNLHTKTATALSDAVRDRFKAWIGSGGDSQEDEQELSDLLASRRDVLGLGELFIVTPEKIVVGPDLVGDVTPRVSTIEPFFTELNHSVVIGTWQTGKGDGEATPRPQASLVAGVPIVLRTELPPSFLVGTRTLESFSGAVNAVLSHGPLQWEAVSYTHLTLPTSDLV